MSKKIVLSGYYGFNNAGDEAVLFSIIKSLQKEIPDVQITVLSNDPIHTKKAYKVNAVNRWKLPEIWKALQKCDLLISGGGSLLQDVTSKNSILYYLGIIIIAKILNKSVFIYAQGIGPINNNRNKRLTAWILNKCNGITVRDNKSKIFLEKIGVKKTVFSTADPVLCISNDDFSEKIGRELLRKNFVNINGLKLGISLRTWMTDERNITALVQACDKLQEFGWQLIFIPMHYPSDVEIAQKITDQMKNPAIILKDNYSPVETLSIINAVDIILGMRLHSLIMAAALDKPFAAISYDPKVEYFLELLNIHEVLDINCLENQNILNLVQNTWENKNNFARNLKGKTDDLRNKALVPAKMVAELLKENN